MAKTLVLFDFDGTITYGDSFLRFIKFYTSHTTYFIRWPFLLLGYILYKLSIISDTRLKEWVLFLYLRNEAKEKLQEKAKDFCSKILEQQVRPGARKCLENHKKQGHTIYVVSASARLWLEPWCHHYGLHLIATHLEFKENKLSGKLQTPNCKDKEKVNRIREEIRLQDFDHIIAYGDTRPDLPMLSLADESHYQPFRG